MRISLLAPPLDPSLNWPRDLRAAMFTLAAEIERLSADIQEADDVLESCFTRRQRAGLDQLAARWRAQRDKLRLFFDSQVFADIKRPHETRCQPAQS